MSRTGNWTQIRSPTSVLTGPDVDQLRWSWNVKYFVFISVSVHSFYSHSSLLRFCNSDAIYIWFDWLNYPASTEWSVTACVVTGTEIARASSADDILNSESHKTSKTKASRPQQAVKLTPAARQTSRSSGRSTPSGAQSPIGRASPKMAGSQSPLSVTPSGSRSHSPAAAVARKLVTEMRNSAKHYWTSIALTYITCCCLLRILHEGSKTNSVGFICFTTAIEY